VSLLTASCLKKKKGGNCVPEGGKNKAAKYCSPSKGGVKMKKGEKDHSVDNGRA